MDSKDPAVVLSRLPSYLEAKEREGADSLLEAIKRSDETKRSSSPDKGDFALDRPGEDMTRFRESEPGFVGETEIAGRSRALQFFAELSVLSAKQFVHEHEVIVPRHKQELEDTQRELALRRRRLAGVIAHELRNFVQVLSSAAAVWQRNPNEPCVRDLAKAQIREMQQLLQQLLEHPSIVGHGNPLQIEAFDPRTLCDELLMTYQPYAEAKKLLLKTDCTGAPEKISGDRIKTKKIAASLLSNALKYTVRGEVSLRMGSPARDPCTMACRPCCSLGTPLE